MPNKVPKVVKRSSHVRPLARLAWNELLEEATEQDKMTEVDVHFENASDEECDGGSGPLNLCSKAVTMPSFNTKKNDQAIDLSGKSDSSLSAKCFIGGSHTMHNFLPNKENKYENNSKTVESAKKVSTGHPPLREMEPHLVNSLAKDNIRRRVYDKEKIIEVKKSLFDTKLERREGKSISPAHEVQKLATEQVKMQNVESQDSRSTNHGIMESVSSMGVCNKEPLNMTPNGKANSFRKDSLGWEGGHKESANNHPMRNEPTPTKVSRTSDDKSCSKPTPEVPNEPDNARFCVPEVPRKRESAKDIVVNGKVYRVLAVIGKGGSSKVLSKDNELLAVKVVKLSSFDEKTRKEYLNEIQHLLKMQHSAHVIRLYDHQYVASHKLLYAVMERGDTDLNRYLKERAASGERISPELILFYWSEILMAVKSIHDNNIIHRDLKPANFLLVSGRLKLIDFGIASSIQSEQTSVFKSCFSGTLHYMSPEALQDLGSGDETILKIGRKTDVWSLGCILYLFLYGKTPYQEFAKLEMKLRTITNPDYKVKFPKIPGVPEVLFESCRRCLIHDKNKRASVEELIELRNQPLLSPSQMLSRLKDIVTTEQYEAAMKALLEDKDET